MDIIFSMIMIIVGFIGSFFSGLLGIGGAIINYPLLLFVPSSLGVANFTAQEVASISIFQVFFASLAGILAYRRKSLKSKDASLIHKGLVLNMGISILLGSLIGGYFSRFLVSDTINIIYGVLAIIAIVLMVIPNKGTQQDDSGEISYNRIIAIVAAFSTGIASGIVGAGGAFILIPVMLTVLKIPTRTTIATSLAIVFISAFGGVIGKITGGPIPMIPTLFAVIGSLLGAPLGSRISAKMNVKYLRYALIILISLTAIKIWMSIL
ncbi:sulfite exporter TauE/SafE family protein [Paenibacillus sp. FA6]|uniref:sulfite exporter TauE/SafE family protein n=1 Tax=Paenibacillus sp. FA6 TaxID=3413029 RepID=UPI003F660B02